MRYAGWKSNVSIVAHHLMEIKEKKETGVAVVSDEEKKSLEKIAGLKFEEMWTGQS